MEAVINPQNIHLPCRTRLWLATVVTATLAACVVSDNASVRVDVVGGPPPRTIGVDRGKCNPLVIVSSDVSYVECGVPTGERVFAVRCKDSSLPEARLRLMIQSGGSQYVRMERVCSSTPQQILKGNEASANAWVWRPAE